MAPGEASPPFSDDCIRRAMRAMVTALGGNRSDEAVREFMQIASAGIVPRNERMAAWLVSIIGKPLAAKLVEAFVHFPCFYCKKGRVDCETCGGRGHNSNGRPCERCIGMRIERCDFCAGSGWVTINYVPEGLRPPVINKRAALAVQRTKALLKLSLPEAHPGGPQAAMKQTGIMILNIDRQMGVFENMLLAARSLPADWRRSRAAIEPVIKRCVLLAAQGEQRICELIHVIAESHRQAAESPNRDAKDRKRLRQQAHYYDSLVDPDRSLTGTGLTHPFLHEAIGDAGLKQKWE